MNKNKDRFESIDDSTVKFETNLIMNRINNLKEKKFYHKKVFIYPILTALLVVLFISTAFSVLNPFNNNGNRTDDNKFTITKVSAHEYEMNNSGTISELTFHIVIENPNLIRYNDEISYHENFVKYLSVNEKTEVTPIEIEGNCYIRINIDGRINLYYQVVKIPGGNYLIKLDNEFNNFEKEIKTLNSLIKEYPPIVETSQNDNGNSQTKNKYSPHKDSGNLESNLYDNYLWYLTILELKDNAENGVCLPAMDFNTRLVIYMDGASLSEIGNVSNEIQGFHEVSTSNEIYNWDNFNEYEYPVKINGVNTRPLGGRGGQDNNINGKYIYESVSEGTVNEKYLDKTLVSIIIDFNKLTNDFKIDDYTIDIKLNEEQITDYDYLINNNKLYIMPLMAQDEFNNDYRISKVDTEIKISDSKGKIIYFNKHSFNAKLIK